MLAAARRCSGGLAAAARRPFAPPPLVVVVAARAALSSSSSYSFSSSSSPRPPPPLPPPKGDTSKNADDDDQPPSTSEKISQGARELHPALVSVLNSGFIESRRRLRDELSHDAWYGEPAAAGGGAADGGAPSPPPPLPHAAPASYAARRGIARFERFLAGGGEGEAPAFPEEAAAALELERAVEGMYAALDSPGTQQRQQQRRQQLRQQQNGDGVGAAPNNPSPDKHEASEHCAPQESTRATLRALARATAALPTARHRMLARAFVEASLAEALEAVDRRAADESRGMADLWGGGGGPGGAAGGAIWGGLKRVLPFGWLLK